MKKDYSNYNEVLRDIVFVGLESILREK